MPDIKFTSSVSTLLLRVSLPSLGLDSVLTFEVGLGKSLNHVQEVIESLVEDVSSELHDEIQEECPNADPHQFKSFFASAETKLQEWQAQLKLADLSVLRAERLRAELMHMREAYHKDLSSLRNQLLMASQPDKEAGSHAEGVMHFDPRKFMGEEERLIADLQQEVAQLKKSKERMVASFEADIEALNDRMRTKDLLSERQALLIETLQKESGELTEKAAAELKAAMSAKEAEYAAMRAGLEARLLAAAKSLGEQAQSPRTKPQSPKQPRPKLVRRHSSDRPSLPLERLSLGDVCPVLSKKRIVDDISQGTGDDLCNAQEDLQLDEEEHDSAVLSKKHTVDGLSQGIGDDLYNAEEDLQLDEEQHDSGEMIARPPTPPLASKKKVFRRRGSQNDPYPEATHPAQAFSRRKSSKNDPDPEAMELLNEATSARACTKKRRGARAVQFNTTTVAVETQTDLSSNVIERAARLLQLENTRSEGLRRGRRLKNGDDGELSEPEVVDAELQQSQTVPGGAFDSNSMMTDMLAVLAALRQCADKSLASPPSSDNKALDLLSRRTGRKNALTLQVAKPQSVWQLQSDQSVGTTSECSSALRDLPAFKPNRHATKISYQQEQARSTSPPNGRNVTKPAALRSVSKEEPGACAIEATFLSRVAHGVDPSATTTQSLAPRSQDTSPPRSSSSFGKHSIGFAAPPHIAGFSCKPAPFASSIRDSREGRYLQDEQRFDDKEPEKRVKGPFAANPFSHTPCHTEVPLPTSAALPTLSRRTSTDNAEKPPVSSRSMPISTRRALLATS